MSRRIIPPAVIPPLYSAQCSRSNGNDIPSPPAVVKVSRKCRHARRHTVSKVTFDTEVAESPCFLRKHSSLKGTKSFSGLSKATARGQHGDVCDASVLQLSAKLHSQSESKAKAGSGKHVRACCEHADDRNIPGRVAEACNRACCEHADDRNIPGRVAEPCNHNTQIYVQISNPDGSESERLFTAPSSQNVTIYMTQGGNNSGGCGRPVRHCGTPRKACRDAAMNTGCGTESEACVKPEGTVQVCLVACRDEGDVHSPEPDEGALFVPRAGLLVNDMRTIKGMSVGVQASQCAQYRLRFLPMCGCTTVDESDWQFCGVEGMFFVLRLVGRWVLSQCGLAMVLTVWALLGAAAFHTTEGPQEERQMRELKVKQSEMAVRLVVELRLVNYTSWLPVIQRQLEQHERALLAAVSAGYGEGGVVGTIWSYPGSILFAVSLLTTLGFGAPVPRTTLGRIAAVVFSAIGIPLHLLLMLNVGVLVAVKLQLLAALWQPGVSLPRALFYCCYPHAVDSGMQKVAEGDGRSRSVCSAVHPRWLKWLPALAILLYYTLGVLVFGVGRSRPLAACMLFPLDFTAAGGVGYTPGFVRVWYAIYLEMAVMLAAISVSVVQMSASKGITNLGLKLGLLTNS